MINKLLFLSLFLLTGCSGYKSTWNCPLEQGIGCSSVEYADEVAKHEIQVNSNSDRVKEIYLNENYFNRNNFEYLEAQE